MNGTIVCVADASEGSNAAVEVARRLAGRFEARIVLVTIAAAPPFPEARNGSGSEEDHRSAFGDPAESVATIAADEAADLIVVGARGGRLGRTLQSSLARELAQTAPCPVVVVPPEVAGRPAQGGTT
ncbi:MAG TPA: universal stress protein [Gaiellaceae bacterium]|nr:universal stress protein [Gaiellaceae bacterium]